MKKRNLILSLICSIILTIALVSFTVVGAISPRKNNSSNSGNNAGNVDIVEQPSTVPADINENADGSEENPYYLYDATSFNTLITEHGTEGANFKLYQDIDFADVDFVPMFANGTAFNGKIDGNGFSLRNININITRNNLSKVIYQSADDENRYNSHIGIFGNVEDAEIVDVKLVNFSVSVADEVYTHINNLSDMFAIEEGASINEITIGTVAGVAKNSTIKASVEASVNADAYSIYAKDNVQGFNAVGGVVGVAFNSTISDGNVKVVFTAKDGKNYFVGGVTGYAYDTTISNMEVNANVTAKYDQVIYVGGVSGYGRAITVADTNVVLSANEAGTRYNTNGVLTIDDSKFTWVAGIVNVIRANDDSQISSISNVNVTAGVDMDVIFAGAVVEIRSTDTDVAKATNKIYVTIKDVVIDANVNTLKAYGLVKYGTHTELSLDKYATDVEGEYTYNIRLTGKVLLNNNDDDSVASLSVVELVNSKTNDVYFKLNGGFAKVQVAVSSSIYSQVEDIETIRRYTLTIVD